MVVQQLMMAPKDSIHGGAVARRFNYYYALNNCTSQSEKNH
jgi:hypothetical protein